MVGRQARRAHNRRDCHIEVHGHVQEDVTPTSKRLVFDSLVGFRLYAHLLASAPAPLVSTYAHVTPLVGAAMGAIVLDEQLWAGAFVGAALVLGAGRARVARAMRRERLSTRGRASYDRARPGWPTSHRPNHPGVLRSLSFASSGRGHLVGGGDTRAAKPSQ